MKNKSFKHQKKGPLPGQPYPNRKPNEPEHEPHRIYPEKAPEREASPEIPQTSPWHRASLERGKPDCIYMDEIIVYYSLN